MKTSKHLKTLLQEDKEKGIKSDGFLIAIQELIFQNEEKEKRAAELRVANEELAFQNEEKEKRAKELEQHEIQLRKAQQVAHMGSWTLDLVSKTVTWSDEACRIAGLDPAEKQNYSLQDCLSFLHPDDIDFVKKTVTDSYHGSTNVSFDHRIVRKDGSLRYIHSESKFEFDSAGKPVGLHGIAHDITERKTTEDALQLSEEKFKALYDSTSDAIMLLTEKGFFDCNTATLKMFGCATKEEFCSKHPADLSPPQQPSGAESLTLANQQINVAIEKGTNNFEWIHKRMDNGQLFYADILLNKIVLEGKPVIEAVVRNIDERKKVEKEITELNESLERKVKERTAQLQQINSDLESFAYSVSHDLRSPLQVINGYSSILLKKHSNDLDTDAQGLLEGIKSYTGKMSLIMESLLNLSRIGMASVVKVSCNMTDIVKASVAELKFGKKNTKLVIKVHNLPDKECNVELVKQLWINLISNAIKYSNEKEKPFIEIGSNKIEGEIVYYVKDNGAGFNMKYAGKLFSPFQRLHAASEFEGTGIGLTIVHRIIAKHGGRIWAEGEVGKGATFYFTLRPQKTELQVAA